VASAQQIADPNQTLGGGQFFGAIQGKQESHGAIFTDLRHDLPRRLPLHSHELPFFALLLGGLYGERYGRRQKQFGPFTLMFRPAGIPHQDEIGPHGVRFFEVELRPNWQKRLADCSGALDLPRDDELGGELLWLALNLYREVHSSAGPDDLYVESLLHEIVAHTARLPKENAHEAPLWLSRVLDKLNAEHCRRLTLDELSAEAGVHPVHLSRVFRRFVGEGIAAHVHRLRIRTACEKMILPKMTLAEVSVATGFADQSHFGRAFRKITGTTPNVFRASLGLVA
jgi:AraC family transcriptional regulator